MFETLKRSKFRTSQQQKKRAACYPLCTSSALAASWLPRLLRPSPPLELASSRSQTRAVRFLSRRRRRRRSSRLPTRRPSRDAADVSARRTGGMHEWSACVAWRAVGASSLPGRAREVDLALSSREASWRARAQAAERAREDTRGASERAGSADCPLSLVSRRRLPPQLSLLLPSSTSGLP
jgi:hypothetical protein